MEDKILKIREEALKSLERIKNLKEWEDQFYKFLGRKSELNTIIKSIKDLPSHLRPQIGRLANKVKQELISLFENKKESFKEIKEEKEDITLPANIPLLGAKHPLTITIEEIVKVFRSLGFLVEEGTEIDTEYFNFQALNIPLEHPSRDVFDTFYLNLEPTREGFKFLLRSHTSPSQIHILERKNLPCRFVVPGRVYRPDKVDASHSFMFHQIEGFWVDRDVRFSHLKGVLNFFAKKIFGEDVEIRFRPHYFPFTEPSVEVDISCFLCKGRGCSVCKNTGFIEILGAGMIHPQVLANCKINSKKWKGFAFGMGVERIAMLKYGIEDIRLFYENDVRFLRSFL